VPGRVASLHLAAAVSGRPLGADAFVGDLEAIARDPAAFWEYPAGSAVHGIPGFVDAAQAEGRRALPDPARAVAALRHELKLISTGGLPALHGLKAPAYLYWGAGDTIVPIAHAAGWWVALPAAVVRVYPDAGHDVQYAHWNDILRDIAEAAG
jgi:pimeloyl-ACP methyl ester carboxylesterase